MGSANSGLKSDNFRKKTQFFEKSLRVSDFATEPIFDKDKPGNRKNATKLTYDHRGYRLHFLKRLVDPRLHLHPPGPGMWWEVEFSRGAHSHRPIKFFPLELIIAYTLANK